MAQSIYDQEQWHEVCCRRVEDGEVDVTLFIYFKVSNAFHQALFPNIPHFNPQSNITGLDNSNVVTCSDFGNFLWGKKHWEVSAILSVLVAKPVGYSSWMAVMQFKAEIFNSLCVCPLPLSCCWSLKDNCGSQQSDQEFSEHSPRKHHPSLRVTVTHHFYIKPSHILSTLLVKNKSVNISIDMPTFCQ